MKINLKLSFNLYDSDISVIAILPTPVSSFEMGPGGNPDETRCMKAYSRSAADQEEVLPHELRPARVLLQCCWFLCDQICTQDQVRVLF